MVSPTDPGNDSPRQGGEEERRSGPVERLRPSEPPFEPLDRNEPDEPAELQEPSRSADRSELARRPELGRRPELARRPELRRLPEDDEDETPGFDWDAMLAQLGTQPLDEGWVTLQEASSATGVARSTLRSWYRSSQIPSRMVAGVHGPQRFVPLDAVIGRALSSSRARRQLEHARSLELELDDLRRRVEALERHLGFP